MDNCFSARKLFHVKKLSTKEIKRKGSEVYRKHRSVFAALVGFGCFAYTMCY